MKQYNILFAIFLLLTNFQYLNSQCVICPEYGAVINGDFESISSDPNCQPPNNQLFYGLNFISGGCVDNWIKLRPLSTPDLINPNMGLGVIDNYISSNMAGLCYLATHNTPGEEMASIFLPSYLIPGSDIEYSIEFDLAGMCVEFNQAISENSLPQPMKDGELNVLLNSNIGGVPPLNVGTFSLDSNNDIFTSGIEHICIPGINLDNVRALINFEVTTSENQDGFASCYGLIDNLEIKCEIVDHELSVSQINHGSGAFTFEILDNGQSISNSSFQSFSWDFGDGQSSLPPLSQITENHQYAQEGIYELCVQIVDNRGCCANICTEVYVGDYCDYSLCLDCTSSGVPLATELKIIDPVSGFPITFNISAQDCCFKFNYCLDDPGYCQQYFGTGGFQFNQLVANINSYLQSVNDPGNAYIYTSSGMSDPNYPCRDLVIVIEHTEIEFVSISGYNAANNPQTDFICPFIEVCK